MKIEAGKAVPNTTKNNNLDNKCLRLLMHSTSFHKAKYAGIYQRDSAPDRMRLFPVFRILRK